MRQALSGAAFLVPLLALLSLDCADTSNRKSLSTYDAVGFVHPGTTSGGSSGPGQTPNVDGVWRASTTLTFSSCGARVPPQTGTRVVDLSQSDLVLNANLFSECGAAIATGTGSVNGSSVFLSFIQDLRVSPNCTLRIQTVQSGSVQNGGESLISGASRTTVSAMGNCGPGLPCEVRANLLMERCPPASCTSQNCP
jgi:hypothetical protein